MEQLISKLVSFILNNFFIVVIVVGLIYTMFFRRSPLEKPPENRPVNRPNNRMPDFGGAPMFPAKPPQSGTPAAGAPVERKGPSPVEHREPRPEYAGPSQPVYRLPERREPEPPQPVYRSQQPQEPDYRSRETPLSVSVEPAYRVVSNTAVRDEDRLVTTGVASARTAESSVSPTQDDLTRAVVWAEILGPPRSRRPFRR